MAARSAPVLERYQALNEVKGKDLSAEIYSRQPMRRIVAHDAEWVTNRALAAMRAHAGEHSDLPYLLFVNYFDAHDPYFPPVLRNERFVPASESCFNGDL